MRIEKPDAFSVSYGRANGPTLNCALELRLNKEAFVDTDRHGALNLSGSKMVNTINRKKARQVIGMKFTQEVYVIMCDLVSLASRKGLAL